MAQGHDVGFTYHGFSPNTARLAKPRSNVYRIQPRPRMTTSTTSTILAFAFALVTRTPRRRSQAAIARKHVPRFFRQSAHVATTELPDTSRAFVIAACCIIVAQYALLQVFGVYSGELPCSRATASTLYASANWGAFALAVPAGLALDRLGPARTSVLGGLLSAGGLMTASSSLANEDEMLAAAGFFVFGFGAYVISTVAVLCAVRAAKAEHASKVSAVVLCCLACGMSVHTAVHAEWFQSQPTSFFQYQEACSLGAGILGGIVFSSRTWQDMLRDEDRRCANTQEGAAADVTQQAGLLASLWESLQSIVRAEDFLWLAVLYLIPVAYSSALLGSWSVCASSLGLSTLAQNNLAFNLGITSAVGRFVFGCLGDWAPKNKPLLGCEVGILGSLCAFQLGFSLLELDQEQNLASALLVQVLGYGGLLALTPAVLRARIPAKDIGTAYGLLFQVLMVSFLVYNGTANPAPGCTGPESFADWFHVASLLNLVVLLCSLWRCWQITRCSNSNTSLV